MFHSIPPAILKRMAFLEACDSRDRADGTERMKRLRQIPPETGRYIALAATSAPEGRIIEIGTSAGYSALWLALAARETGRPLTTFEVLPDKAALARETFHLAEVESEVELIEGDALAHLKEWSAIAFCFLDAEKEVYQACYDLVIPKLVQGGLLLADNAISHGEELKTMLDLAKSDPAVDAQIVPVGKGILYCRKLSGPAA